jgi:hypothetical protein
MCTIAAAIGAVGAVGSLMQGQAAKSAANAQAAANETNARLADEQARDAVRRGAYDELKFRRQMSILQGEQRSALAASGVEVDTGSPLALQEASRKEGDQDAAVIRFNAEREAWGHSVQAVNYRNAASAARASGHNAMTAGVIGAGTGLLNVAGEYSTYMKGKSVTPTPWGTGTKSAYVPPDSIASWDLYKRKVQRPMPTLGAF